MSTDRDQSSQRWRPGLGDLIPVLVAFAALSNAARLLADGDTGWHIRTGDWILREGRVPTVDPFSFSAAGHAWYAWEWLSDLAFALAHRAGGLPGVVAGSALLLGWSFWLVYRRALASGGRPLVSLGVCLLGAMVTMVHWLARPHLFSFLMTAVYVWILETGSPKRARWPLLLLAPLSALWTNLHGGFLVGYALIGAYLVGGLLPGSPRRWRPRDLGLALALAVLASCANPYGPKLLPHAVGYASNSEVLRHIDEHKSPDFQSVEGRFLEGWLLLCGLALGPMLRARDWPRLLATAGLAHMALTAHRHVDFLVVATAPWIAAALATEPLGLVRRWTRLRERVRGVETIEAGSDNRWGPGLAAALAAWATLSPAAWDWAEPFEFPRSKFPVAAADHLQQLGAKRVASFDDHGDYLIYCCWPDVLVLGDGRTDLYVEAGVWDAWLAMTQLAPGWVSRIEAYAPDTMLFPRRSAVARWLMLGGRWAPAYADEFFVILRQDAPRDERLLDELLAGDR